MSSSLSELSLRRGSGRAFVVLSGWIATAMALAGCSADFERMNSVGRLNISDGSGAPTPSRGIGPGYDQSLSSHASAAKPASGDSPRWDDRRPSAPSAAIRSAALPDATPSVPRPPRVHTPPLPTAPSQAMPRRVTEPRPITATSGGEITVVRGDTLYALSRKHGVSIETLMSANGLTSHDLKPGQRLALPGSQVAAAPRRVGTGVVAGGRPKSKAAALQPNLSIAAAAPPASTKLGGARTEGGAGQPTYRVRPGDSLYAVARRHKVTLADLQRANAITDPRKVRPGTVLVIPSATLVPRALERSTPVEQATELAPKMPPAPAPAAQPSDAAVPSYQRPTIINRRGDAKSPADQRSQNDTSTLRSSADVRLAAVAGPSSSGSGNTSPEATAAARALNKRPAATTNQSSSQRLKWPVHGKIIGEFGPRTIGGSSDGIDIAAPVGTTVHAAGDGEVSYASDQLKSYGNLVLIRHPNGWVTTYAHNSELLVKRGDKVKRGQPIAKSGMTGQVDRPMVHFEIREGRKPMDPLPLLERI